MEESNASIGTILQEFDLDVRTNVLNCKVMFTSVHGYDDNVYEYERKGASGSECKDDRRKYHLGKFVRSQVH